MAFTLVSVSAAHASGLGYVMFPGVRTGEKPQSKLFHHDGAWWAVLQGPSGMAIYEKVGPSWRLDALLGGAGKADVVLRGDTLIVLVLTTASYLSEFTYDAPNRTWTQSPTFPVAVPAPSDAEALVLAEDSNGRLWFVCESGDSIAAYYTLASHAQWSTQPVLIESGVDADDIAAIVAFAGDRVGVFWSDQNRDRFGFRVHHDTDDPLDWGAIESVFPGMHHADDHVNLATDSSGRVYAVTKDDFDRMHVHRRTTDGVWSSVEDVLDGTGNRGIIMLSEADSTAYVVYTDWSTTPASIAYRSAPMSDLAFDNTQSLILSVATDLDDVSGTKQLLPAGSLAVVARGGGNVWWNAIGHPSAVGFPNAPPSVFAIPWSAPERVEVLWSAPESGAVDGYHVYRSVNESPLVRLTTSPIAEASIIDTMPPDGTLCYSVSSVAAGLESNLSVAACTARGAPCPPQLTEVWAHEVFYDVQERQLHQLGGSDLIGTYDGRGTTPPRQDVVQATGPPVASTAQAGPHPSQRIVELTWSPHAFGLEATSYTVYRSVDSGTPVAVATVPHPITEYADTDVPVGVLCYSLSATNEFGEGTRSDGQCTDAFTSGTSTSPDAGTGAGAVTDHELSLIAAPNPFNPRTQFEYRLESTTHVTLEVYDARGRRVAQIVAGRMGPGVHRVLWDGRTTRGVQLPTGAYWARLAAGSRKRVVRVILLQ